MLRFADRWSFLRWPYVAGLVTAAVTAAALAGADPGVAATLSGDSAAAGYTVTRIPTGGTYGAALDTASGSLYALTWGGVVQVLNAATGQLTGTVSVPAGGWAIAADSAANRVYVGSGSVYKPSLTVLDGTTNTVVSRITLPLSPISIAVDPVTDTIYALDQSELSVINGATDTVTRRVATTGNPGGVAVDPVTDKIYVTEHNWSEVQVIDGSTGTATATVKLPDFPQGIAVDPATNTIYTANQYGTMSVIDGVTNTVTRTVDLSFPGEAIAVDPARGTVVVTEGDSAPPGATAIINAATGAVTDSLSRGGDYVVIDPATGDIYAASRVWGIWRLIPGSVNQTCPFLLTTGVSFDAGVPASVLLQSDAAPAATFSEAGALPAGVTLSPAGVLSGTPAPGTTGTYHVQVTLANGVAPDDTSNLTVTVNPAPAITSPARATFTAGTAGTFTMQATGQVDVWTGETGSLPSGVTFTPDDTAHTGTLSGTPGRGTGGTYKITFTASDPLTTATQPFTLTVDEAPSFTSPATVTFRAGASNSFTIRARGFPAARITEQGTLPRDVTFRANSNGTATLSGKPLLRARGRTFRLNITASNGIGAAARQVLTLLIH